ncbi:hypothetical protein AMK30_02570 [Streptomyces sp. CB02460]|nr:hypothetical protein AMK30_02570 [Streptomyces sp. CB02460]
MTAETPDTPVARREDFGARARRPSEQAETTERSVILLVSMMLITSIASSRRLGGTGGPVLRIRISTARSQGFREAAVSVVKNLW